VKSGNIFFLEILLMHTPVLSKCLFEVIPLDVSSQRTYFLTRFWVFQGYAVTFSSTYSRWPIPLEASDWTKKP